jgi:predicted Kef-type K+ transport protein
MCSSAGLSKVEAITSPSTDLAMSVTSSGRSSTRSTIRITSGWLVVTALAMFLSTVVLPALGGDTISALCPFPMGEKRSITLAVSSVRFVSRTSLSSGNMGVSFSKWGLFLASSGSE